MNIVVAIKARFIDGSEIYINDGKSWGIDDDLGIVTVYGYGADQLAMLDKDSLIYVIKIMKSDMIEPSTI